MMLKVARAEVTHLATVAMSDHMPILLRREPEVRRSHKRVFRYEVAWESHKEFEDTLREKWKSSGSGDNMSMLQEKLDSLSRDGQLARVN
jgi:hypothetical protein